MKPPRRMESPLVRLRRNARFTGLTSVWILAGIGPAVAQHTTTRIYGSASLIMPLEIDQDSDGARISADGTLIAFRSLSPLFDFSLDTNSVDDVFVADLLGPGATLVSKSTSGAVGDGPSFNAAISPDGLFVAFASDATNLDEVVADTNGVTDIFVHDLAAGTTERITVDASGNEANGPSRRPAISEGGRYVVFDSTADNLIASDGNGVSDVFLYDRLAGTHRRVSETAGGLAGNLGSFEPDIDAAAEHVVFHTVADNLGGVDTNGVEDVYLFDVGTGTLTLLSESTSGGTGDGASLRAAISRDGRFACFASRASDLGPSDLNGLLDVYRVVLSTGAVDRISVGSSGGESDGPSDDPRVSDKGHVVFSSRATNLPAGGDPNGTIRDIFVRSPAMAAAELISADSAGGSADDDSFRPDISADSCDYAFSSDATDLVKDDTNGFRDVFHHRDDSFCPTFDLDHVLVKPGSSLCLSSGGGVPFKPLAVFLVGIDRSPVFFLLLVSVYDDNGFFKVALNVPQDSALVGHLATLRVFTVPPAGKGLVRTNPRYVYIDC